MTITTTLKEKTWDIHKRVENAELNQKLFSADLDVETYGLILERFHSVFAPIEEAIASFEPCQNVGYRNRSDLIRADLGDLGIDVALTDAKTTLPDFDTPEKALGAAYVLEGSNMGAAFIKKRVLAVLGKDTFTHGGISFFSQTQTGGGWNQFKARMDAHFGDLSQKAQKEALDGAIKTFETFEAEFNQFEHSSSK